MIKTFEPDGALDAWDVLFSAMRCGEVKLGQRVKIWNAPFSGDYRDAGYVYGVTESYQGQPAVRELKSDKLGRRTRGLRK